MRAVAGGPEVMQEQLRYPLRLTHERDALEFRVLSSDTPRDSARGGFTVFGFGGKGAPVGFPTTLLGRSPTTAMKVTTASRCA
ncbi:Scr1 family TA system antitoxin-like transcriptional regulator [Halosaccharopolyspora lacisalsi]|uniref:Scr1 family TA system antitoxin-like transcriptional regulator n=1 Tax=Halosaccharopolyspora lacisalsi TaxID=1000566 RepID=UPI0038B408A0